jgi:hypothetical protein
MNRFIMLEFYNQFHIEIQFPGVMRQTSTIIDAQNTFCIPFLGCNSMFCAGYSLKLDTLGYRIYPYACLEKTCYN